MTRRLPAVLWFSALAPCRLCAHRTHTTDCSVEFSCAPQGLGDTLGLALPVAAAANEQFKRARGDHGDDDFCAVYHASKK